MLKNLARCAGGVFVFSALAYSPVDSGTQAALVDATWIESVLLTTSEGDDSGLGIDDAVPEPLTTTLTGDTYSLEGSVAFPEAGAPNTAVALAAQNQSGLTLIGALAGSRIDFQFRVVESAVPPVSVTEVPVHIHAHGTAEASGDSTLRAASFSLFNLVSGAGLILSWSVEADNTSGGAPPSDSFDNDDQLVLALGEVVSGELLADGSMGADNLPPGVSAQAGATADPVIEVADVLIPGTSENYRSYFEIEFSPGYFALGQSPVERTTWGKIKRRYGP